MGQNWMMWVTGSVPLKGFSYAQIFLLSLCLCSPLLSLVSPLSHDVLSCFRPSRGTTQVQPETSATTIQSKSLSFMLIFSGVWTQQWTSNMCALVCMTICVMFLLSILRSESCLCVYSLFYFQGLPHCLIQIGCLISTNV